MDAAAILLLLMLALAVGNDEQKPSSDESAGQLTIEHGEEEPCQMCFSASCTPFLEDGPHGKFNPVRDSAVISKAVSTMIADTKTIYKTLCERTETQRQQIVSTYTETGMRLGLDLHYSLSGHFRELMIAMVTPLVTFYARKLGRAISDGNRPVTSEILASLTPCMIRKVATKHHELYDHDLFGDLDRSKIRDMLTFSNSDYVDIVQSLAQGDRDESTEIDADLAVDDAVRLRTAGWQHKGTDVQVFIEIFTKRSMTQLAETLTQYEELRRDDGDFISLEEDIKSEFTSRNIRAVFMNIARNALDQPLYFAEELDKVFQLWIKKSDAMQKLIRIIRGRGAIDMQEIKAAYRRKYGRKLEDGLKSGFYWRSGGQFLQGLLAIVNPPEEM